MFVIVNTEEVWYMSVMYNRSKFNMPICIVSSANKTEVYCLGMVVVVVVVVMI
jgi:hypothetical protein